jgi:hypothetical protein
LDVFIEVNINFKLATQFKLGQAFQNMNERPFSITRREVVRLMGNAATTTLFRGR